MHCGLGKLWKEDGGAHGFAPLMPPLYIQAFSQGEIKCLNASMDWKLYSLMPSA